jgi:hypothetical protein
MEAKQARSEEAEFICTFIELLNIPTIKGNSEQNTTNNGKKGPESS